MDAAVATLLLITASVVFASVVVSYAISTMEQVPKMAENYNSTDNSGLANAINQLNATLNSEFQQQPDSIPTSAP